MTCRHENFEANVAVGRLEDSGRFMCEIRVHCTACKSPFQFLGLQPGIDLNGASVSMDGLEANIAICPQGMQPNPFQQMAHGLEKFDG